MERSRKDDDDPRHHQRRPRSQEIRASSRSTSRRTRRSKNGVIERFYRSLKEEYVWLTNPKSFKEARGTIKRWIRWAQREAAAPAFGLPEPVEYRAQEVNLVARNQGRTTSDASVTSDKTATASF